MLLQQEGNKVTVTWDNGWTVDDKELQLTLHEAKVLRVTLAAMLWDIENGGDENEDG